ncbi:Aminotransferase class-III, partial [mine drainage metagenome]
MTGRPAPANREHFSLPRPFAGGFSMSDPTVPSDASTVRASARGVRLVSPIPGPRARQIIERDRHALMTATKSSPIVAASASGVWVTDVDGNRLLDFAAGIAVHAVGHCHPEVVRAVREQAGILAHFAGTDFYYDLQVTLAEKIASLAPGSAEKKVFFTNSGTESAEAA